MVIDLRKYLGANHTRDLHLLALEIASIHYKGYPIVLEQYNEGFDIVESGLEEVVKECADKLSIPYDRITVRSTDRLVKSKIFKHVFNKTDMNIWRKSSDFMPTTVTIPEKNYYALLIGRATNERLYAFSISSAQNSIRTCHLDIESISEHQSDFTQFICEHNDKWQAIKHLFPYSDIGEYIKPPIILGNVKDIQFWENVYRNVSIEVVCETSTASDTFFMSEKTLRPIAYGRLFLIIGSPEYEKNLKGLGFDIFEDILDKSYDSVSGYTRVDKVFNSLQKYLSNPIDYSTILDRLESNRKKLREIRGEGIGRDKK